MTAAETRHEREESGERVLGCVIEGVGPDQVLMRFTLKRVDEDSRSTHEVSFVLGLSSQFSYKGTSYRL